MNPIEVKQLGKSFGNMEVLRGLDLSVPAGSIYGLLGRNGAGKSTLLRILMGLTRADAGSATVFGHELFAAGTAAKADVAYVGQGAFLPDSACLKDLIHLESGLRPRWNPATLDAWLDRQRIDRGSSCARLSGGQLKRFELELALAAQPKLFLLDEPFAGLDPVSRDELVEQLLSQASEGETTLVLSSHIISDLEGLCDRVGVLSDGVIAFESTLNELKERSEQGLEDVALEILRHDQQKELRP